MHVEQSGDFAVNRLLCLRVSESQSSIDSHARSCVAAIVLALHCRRARRLRQDRAAAVSAGHDATSSPSRSSPKHQQAIANILGAMFGTPDEPFALPETGLDRAQAEDGRRARLERSRPAASTACIAAIVPIATASPATATARRPSILNPYPRDYRPGVFKFKSTYTAAAADRRRPPHESCTTAFPARRCRRSRCCRRTRSTRWSST